MPLSNDRGDLSILLSLLDHADRGHARVELFGHFDEALAPQHVAERNIATGVPAVFRHLQLSHPRSSLGPPHSRDVPDPRREPATETMHTRRTYVQIPRLGHI